jgi:eukaryotic-like serine/threonine-protein kinase
MNESVAESGSMAWQPGDKLNKNKYAIEQELGQGRFGITYLARDRQGKPLVIKTLKDDVLTPQISDEERNHLESKFLNEAMKLAKCDHPHIVKVIETFKEGKIWCIAMEYIAGEDLEKRRQKGLSVKEALSYIQEIGEALIVVHRHGFQHLDVKPENIMVREGTGEAVLIDFGLARGFKDKFTTMNPKIPITVDGFAPLELYYPDAERGDYTDVYALAATLYALLTGDVPPKSLDRSLKKQGSELISPKEKNKNIPELINQAIVKGLELDAGERPQKMAEWLVLLGLRHEQSNPHPDVHHETLHLTRRQTKMAILAFWVGVAGIIVAIIIGLFPQELKSIIMKPFVLPQPSSTASPTTK